MSAMAARRAAADARHRRRAHSTQANGQGRPSPRRVRDGFGQRNIREPTDTKSLPSDEACKE
jgi:hypothetical protein